MGPGSRFAGSRRRRLAGTTAESVAPPRQCLLDDPNTPLGNISSTTSRIDSATTFL